MQWFPAEAARVDISTTRATQRQARSVVRVEVGEGVAAAIRWLRPPGSTGRTAGIYSWGMLVQGRSSRCCDVPGRGDGRSGSVYRTPHPLLELILARRASPGARELLDEVPGGHQVRFDTTTCGFFHEEWMMWAEGDPGRRCGPQRALR